MSDTGVAGQAQSPLDAISEMRSTAKWMIAALGAVGASLLAAFPLGALNGVSNTTDLIWATIGLVLGISGVAYAIWRTAEALSPPITTLSSVNDDGLKTLRTLLDASPETFYGPFGNSVHDLVEKRRYYEHAVISISKLIASNEDSSQDLALQRALAEQESNARLARNLQKRLLEFAHAWQVREQLRKARIHAMAAVGVIIIGVVLIMIAAIEH
ncbi:hypothetical protein [Glycomyces sp. NPDC021274]|uniref:hypothetical protein n=1 Tax=Glycomyces sp. NPDC021274 TaxID=3155120 RepID=UPI0033E575A4